MLQNAGEGEELRESPNLQWCLRRHFSSGSMVRSVLMMTHLESLFGGTPKMCGLNFKCSFECHKVRTLRRRQTHPQGVTINLHWWFELDYPWREASLQPRGLLLGKQTTPEAAWDCLVAKERMDGERARGYLESKVRLLLLNIIIVIVIFVLALFLYICLITKTRD